MVELLAQFRDVDLLGELDRSRPVGQRERRVHVPIQPPDHLQHQELVEIGVEQRPDDRIELERMVENPPRDISL